MDTKQVTMEMTLDDVITLRKLRDRALEMSRATVHRTDGGANGSPGFSDGAREGVHVLELCERVLRAYDAS